MTTQSQIGSADRAVRIAVIGAGRIGEVHITNLTRRVKGAVVTGVFDSDISKAEAIGERFGVPARPTLEALLTEGGPVAVVVGSPSAFHLEHVKKAASAGLHVLCEKPLALDEEGIAEAIEACASKGRILQVGFNRRFDPNSVAVREEVDSGRLGKVRSLRITSRDPWPPSIDYVRSSGGMIMDMTIHDLDLARFLTGEEVVEVSAFGGCLIDPEIGNAGDIDLATIMLRFESGAVGVVENTRATPYGYDQRVEVLGSDASIESENMTPSRVVKRSASGQTQPNPLPFFLQRYEEAFSRELQHFVDAVREAKAVAVSGKDALHAHRIAQAVQRSLASGRPERVTA
ncbi:inositol 2-dehydrogenase [Sinorhizobium sp. BG8]|uniref:inositol 2-dehydrogenase n=1 Tax=Sinorhizobium sp. BG8 TaxID=2613773 RepID=UPI00193E2435|nr:inositol 2-dehydrogenase [Sinorhizobium sp. BG8]